MQEKRKETSKKNSLNVECRDGIKSKETRQG